MPTPAWDDLGAFLSLDDFAVTAKTSGGQTFPIILEEAYFSHELGAYDLNTAEPWGTAKWADVQGLKKRALVTLSQSIAGVQTFSQPYWLVHDPEPDGTGMAVLRLSRTADA